MWKGCSALDCFLPLPGVSARTAVRCELTQTQPPRTRLEDVGEDALFVHLAGRDLVVQNVGAVGHRDIAEHADRDDLLRRDAWSCLRR